LVNIHASSTEIGIGLFAIPKTSSQFVKFDATIANRAYTHAVNLNLGITGGQDHASCALNTGVECCNFADHFINFDFAEIDKAPSPWLMWAIRASRNSATATIFNQHDNSCEDRISSRSQKPFLFMSVRITNNDSATVSIVIAATIITTATAAPSGALID
jgi:hypothetical protein